MSKMDLKTSKTLPTIAIIDIFGHLNVFHSHPSNIRTSYCCRGGPKLQFDEYYIKISQELA